MLPPGYKVVLGQTSLANFILDLNYGVDSALWLLGEEAIKYNTFWDVLYYVYASICWCK